MPLTELELPPADRRDPRLPGDVCAVLRAAERRIRRFQRRAHLPGFVPSDFAQVYAVLRGLAAADLAPGRLFCEWGSGFGVVTCLAALLDFDAFGIEIEAELVDAARRLADDFGLPAEFAHGSFLPPGRRPDGEFAWLSTDGADGHAELGLAAEDFSVIFAYPWPDEEGLTERLFARHAGAGAVLVTYHGGDDFRLRRKARCQAPRKRRGPRTERTTVSPPALGRRRID
jgi:hypothetical protein